MLFSPKWSQNVSKLLFFSFSVFKQMLFSLGMCYLKLFKKEKYSETLTPHISKCEFSQPGGMGVVLTQKRKVVVI